jgi:hypothetical protein
VPSLRRLTRKDSRRAAPGALPRLARCLPPHAGGARRSPVRLICANSFPSRDISRVGADKRGTLFAILVYRPTAPQPLKGLVR